ncbi:SDR family oxidoreductase [Nibrella viscosa]|uniref:SDR family oxidoreductase n=1 Tax=Nibrella viscosa TaxID=1084524 RepID=A0ABP8KHR4_9BACT
MSDRATAVAAPAGFFAGKVAIVTGSESGIGRATALELGRQGARVVLNGRTPEKLTQTYNECVELGFTVVSCLADVTCYESCNRLIDAALLAFGSIDILITNASISMRAYFAETQPDVFRQVLDSNVYGSVYPLKAALPHLIRSKGSVTFISSISAINGMPSSSAYCAGKAALANLAHTLRLELAHTGMHIGVVYLGFTRNDPEKRVLNAQGVPVPIAYRPLRWQKSQTEVALAILKHIKNRKKQTILSALGHLNAWMNRFLPNLADYILRQTYNRLRRMYE